MSIPLVRNNTKDAINTSIIAIKKNLERINSLLGLMDNSDPDLSGLATKQELENAVTEINNTIDEVETSLQPVDTVTSGNMQSVTSNAVFNEIANLFKLSFGELPNDANNASGKGNLCLYAGQTNPRNLLNYPSITYSSAGNYPCYILIDFYPNIASTRITQLLIVTYYDGNGWRTSNIYKRSKIDAIWFGWVLLHSS